MAMTGGTAKLVKTGYAEYGNTSLPIKLYVYYKTSQDVEKNQSTITVGMYVTTPSSSYGIGEWTDHYGSYVGTSSLTFNGTVPNFKGTRWIVENKQFTVDHNADGTGKATIYWKWGVNSPWGQFVNPSGSFEITLPTIARLSVPTVSATSVAMGKTVTIKMNRKSTSFKHVLMYTFGSVTTETQFASSVGDSYTWTVPDLAAKCNNASSGTCTIYCHTYSGSTYLGTKTVTLTLTVPDATTPTLSATSVKMGGSVTLGVSGRKSTNFKHSFQYSFGSKADVAIKDGVTSSYTWTVPDLAKECNNATSGTCTIKCHTYNGTKCVGTVSKTITLQVPDASVPTLSASTITMGNSLTIYTNRKSSNFTHKIEYDFHGKKGTPSSAATTSCNLPVTIADFAGYIPSATSGTGTITCTTKNGTATVGTKTVTFTATVPDNATTKPSFTSSGFTLTPSGSIPSAFDGLFIQGKTGVSASFSAYSTYSTIASYKMTAEGDNYSGNPATSRAFSTSGTKTITGTVTDARGFSTVLSKDITVIPYNTPKLIPYGSNKSIVCERCTSDGTPYDGGSFLKIKVGRRYSKVMSGTTQKNFCTVGYRYKTSAATSYSSDVILIKSSDTFEEVDTEPIAGIVESLTTSYDVQIFVTDTMGESDEYTVRVPTAGTDFHLREGGKGAAFGKYAEIENGVEFEWDVYGRAYGLGKLIKIQKNSDLNDEKYRNFGCYGITLDSIAETIGNLPYPYAGVLRVFSSAGDGNFSDEAGYVYITQEYTPYTGIGIFRRRVTKRGADGGWQYGDWSATGGVDSVVESGSVIKSGVTWHYRKWFDGTAECWARRSVTVDTTTAWGTALYYGTVTAIDLPFAYAEEPFCTIYAEKVTTSSVFAVSNGAATTSRLPSVFLVRGTSETGINATIIYTVRGRWK